MGLAYKRATDSAFFMQNECDSSPFDEVSFNEGSPLRTSWEQQFLLLFCTKGTLKTYVSMSAANVLKVDRFVDRY